MPFEARCASWDASQPDMPAPRRPWFIDFEASSLGPDSYPIEVAWCDAFGVVTEHLINPQPVPYWTDWDYIAEHNVHHIPRSLLLAQGKPPREVTQAMTQALAGKTLVSDVAHLDQFWAEALYDAVDQDPPFKIIDLPGAMQDGFPDLTANPQDCFRLIDRFYREQGEPVHRAGRMSGGCGHSGRGLLITLGH